MIEIPIGKAIIAVESPVEHCKGCCFIDSKKRCLMENLNCFSGDYKRRKDGKNVIFKIVDYKGEK
jgi:hypothetical protein